MGCSRICPVSLENTGTESYPWNGGERSEQSISGCKRNALTARCSWAMPWLQGQPRRMTLPLPLETSPISGASTSRLSTPGTSRTRRRASRLQLAGAPRARASSPAPHPAGQGPEPVAGGNLGRHVSRLKVAIGRTITFQLDGSKPFNWTHRKFTIGRCKRNRYIPVTPKSP